MDQSRMERRPRWLGNLLRPQDRRRTETFPVAPDPDSRCLLVRPNGELLRSRSWNGCNPTCGRCVGSRVRTGWAGPWFTRYERVEDIRPRAA